MCEIGDVFIVNTNSEIEYRNKKHCVYVSVTKDYVLLINETQRPELYDGIEIKRSKQNQHWLDKTRYIGCRNIFDMSKFSKITKCGKLAFKDIEKISEYLEKYKDDKHIFIKSEIDQYIQEN